jgi:hypothetical protein
MNRLTSLELMAALTPKLLDQFDGWGVIDLRVFPGKPDTLFVYVHLFAQASASLQLELLQAVAARAGIAVERRCEYGQTIWIEVPASGETGTVVPFPSGKRQPCAVAADAH